MNKYRLHRQEYIYGPKWVLITPAGVRCESDDWSYLQKILAWHVDGAFSVDAAPIWKYYFPTLDGLVH